MTVSTSPVEQDELRQLVQLVRQGAEANERPDLVGRMRTAADMRAAPGSTADVAATVVRALESLEIDLQARRRSLGDPGRGARLDAEWRHAETRLRRFQDRAAKWPRMLGDALAAADSDLEYAVQSRLRSLLDEGTALIGAGNRGDEVERRLRDRLLAEADACHQALRSAAEVVAGRLASSLELTVAAPPVTREPPEQLVARLHRRPPTAADRQPLPTRLLGIVMPTYSGMMVALVLPRLFGIRMPLWLIVAAAVVGAFAMGGAAVTGERQRQAGRRAADTIGDLRSTVDAFRMALGKQVRDGVRGLDQQLRAEVDEAVSGQTRRLSAAAESSRKRAEAGRQVEQSLTDIDTDLDSVRELRLRARQIAAEG
ncbi:hypothetical protein ACWKSP_28895 [Micromonosporaceae bacterium Da 78-11]